MAAGLPEVVILDDYQDVALTMADWSGLEGRAQVRSITRHISDRDALVEAIGDAAIVVAMRERTAFDAALLARLPALRLLVTTGMANKSIDLAAASTAGIMVCGTPGSSASAAELAFGLMMALARQIPQETIRFRERDPAWQRVIGTDLAGRTLGLIGLGRLGRKMALYAKAFDMNVLAWSRSLDEATAGSHGAELAPSLDALLAASDFVSIHVPLNAASTRLIGAAELSQMKKTAFLINTSRGPIIDETALIEALGEDRIAGAGLDVFDIEPLPLDHAFRKLPTLIATPHMGYVTQATYRQFFDGIVEAIVGYLDQNPVRRLNP